MKKLYLIGGTMGVGKSAVCEILNKKLPNSVYLDGDWCWNADPFIVAEETKAMVHDNIAHILNNFINCPAYENVVFCWVMHEQFIIDKILKSICTDGCQVVNVSLICDENSLIRRLQKDIERGKRTADIIERSIARLPLYEKLDTIKIDTSGKPAEAVANEIISLTGKGRKKLTMKKLIAYCGLDCEKCDARKATLTNDNALREKVAKFWSEMNGVEITAEMINCEGCRENGVKTPFCDSLCPIRQCALGKAYETCGSCSEMESCKTVGIVISNNAEAAGNLKNKG